MLYVMFHKRGRVFYQGLETRENNKNHKAVDRVISLFFLICKTREKNENHEAADRVIFIVLECSTNAREQ